MSNKSQNSNYFSLLQKSGLYKNMLNFMAIVYVQNLNIIGSLIGNVSSSIASESNDLFSSNLVVT